MNHLRVRCPSCAKLYEVDVDAISSFSPQFECVGCATRFSFDFPPEDPLNIHAQIVETHDEAFQSSVAKMKSCPKCGAMNKPHSTECYSCQIIFDRFEKLQRRANTNGTLNLVELWQKLVQDFGNQNLHQDFITSCQKQNALEFALKQYQELQKLLGDDPECSKLIAKVEAMIVARRIELDFQKKTIAEEKARISRRWDKLQVWFPYVLSMVLILDGFLSRGNRNMIGFGIALALLSTGLLYFIRGSLSVRDFID